MSSGDSAADLPANEGGSWRELAVTRSLDSARSRAESRVQRFMAAATELINSGNGKDFTVYEVVERSGQSLRSFYQLFDGKHELLLALFEESVLSTAEQLRQKVAQEKDPFERLHRFVVEYHRLCGRSSGAGAQSRKGAPAVVTEFAQQLLTDRPKEAASAFAPLADLFGGLLEEAVATGRVRTDLPARRVTGIVLEAVMFNAFSSTIAGTSNQGEDQNAAEELWDLIVHGIGTAPS
jgi:AcrR family transcriptional regulator